MAKYQIQRSAAETWEVWRYEHQDMNGDLVTHWERIGRVTKCGDGLYRAELPKWVQNGCEWERQSRGYATPQGAWRTIIAPVPEPTKWKQ